MHQFPFVTKRVLSLCLGFAVGGLSLVSVQAAPPASIRIPKAGSAERKALFDALRKPVSAFCKTPVTFTHADVRIGGNWAYVQAQTVDKHGKKVGIKEMNNYNDLDALLSRSGKTWRVREWVYPSDVVSIDWEHKYPAVPKNLWPHNRPGMKPPA